MYIGRAWTSRSGRHLGASKWANPFRLRDSRNPSECVAKFDSYLKASRHLQNDLLQLCGRRLVCHCKPNALCHGDALIAAVAERLSLPSAATTLLLGVPFSPAEFVHQAAWVDHPFQAHYCEEVIQRGLMQRMSMSTRA